MNISVNIPMIQERAMLAYITASVWSARKLDRKATGEVTRRAKATTDAARVNKHLLANADTKLKAIQKIGADARRYLEANSLPWDDAGNRMLSNEKALEVVGTLNAMKTEFSEAVDAFVVEYPMLRAQALVALGDMADSEDYPQPDAVRHKFRLDLSLTPIPTGFGDIREGLQAAQIDALKRSYEARFRMQHHVAMNDAWGRLRDSVEKIAERLDNSADPANRKVFRNSLFQNARDTCKLLKGLNVFDDAALNQTMHEVEQYLCNADADVVREQPAVADTIKFQADAILANMKALLGE